MNKLKLTITWAMLVLLAAGVCGCALLGTALSAAAAYGIYQASK